MAYSKGKISAFLGEPSAENRIGMRKELLSDRYLDLKEEIESIEYALNMSPEKEAELLYNINENIFCILETLLPELSDTEEIYEQEDVDDAMRKRKERADKIKQREKSAIEIQKDKEEYLRARSFIKTARIDSQTADTPEKKKKANSNLRKALTQLKTLNTRTSDE